MPTAAYWRERAERAKRCAADMTPEGVRTALLDIAIVYESMAERAARREARAQRSESRSRGSPQGQPRSGGDGTA